MVTGKLISLNTRGISNYRKRRTIFTWLRKQKPDVVFLQETHSTQGNEVFWQREWLICSHGANIYGPNQDNELVAFYHTVL